MKNVFIVILGFIALAFACDQKATAQTTDHPEPRIGYMKYRIDTPFEWLYYFRTPEGAQCYVLASGGQIDRNSMSCVKALHIDGGYSHEAD